MELNTAVQAARLAAFDPVGLGGLWLRFDSPTDCVVEEIGRVRPVRVLPAATDAERLDGGTDLLASLAAGRPIRRPGLIQEMAGGFLVVPRASRLEPAIAGRLAIALDSGLIGLVIAGAIDELSAALADRLAFHLDDSDAPAAAGASSHEEELGPADEAFLTLARVADQLGVVSQRALLFAHRAAQASARLGGRAGVAVDDIALAARLVLAPRATRIPAEPDQPPQQQEPAPDRSEIGKLEDIVLDAARAALPPGLLDPVARAGRGAAPSASGAGERRKSPVRGRPVGTRPGPPRGGTRLALIDTIRAAAPWQAFRGASNGRLALRRDDLRVRRFQDRAESLTIFAVDASGSSAVARLAEAKGAVELLLAKAYARRAEVALIAFRERSAELLLPPTRSLTRARRLLAELPGGGSTPLAAGIESARGLAELAAKRGRTPFIVLLTDGRANIALDGSAGRVEADRDAGAAAKRILAGGFGASVIDIGARPDPAAARIAAAMGAQCVHLPRADANALHAALA